MTIVLKLYVTGTTSRAIEARRKTSEIVEHFLSDCELEVIDILERPDLAERDRIIATPTIVRVSPAPIRKVIGDISDPHTLLNGLGLVGGEGFREGAS
ncbi:MAG: circadian clock KaiB family protein [Actinomycetota bacterium]